MVGVGTQKSKFFVAVALGLHCYWASLVAARQSYPSPLVHGLLMAVTSLVAEDSTGSRHTGFNSCVPGGSRVVAQRCGTQA